jgi:hypothetical protein
MSLMNETSADLSMACSPDIWELKMFLWTSADMIAWNDVLLEMEVPVVKNAVVTPEAMLVF